MTQYELLLKSLMLLEEMIDNHNADAVQMSNEHLEETKVLVREIKQLLKQ